MADLFYFFFMFVMANLMLWLFLAIFFDTYTEVRAESHRGPSAWAELATVLSSANEWAPRFLPGTSKGCTCCGRARAAGRSGGAARDDATLAEVLHEATKGSLRSDSTISALSLVHALGLTEISAKRLIRDALLISQNYPGSAAGSGDANDGGE